MSNGKIKSQRNEIVEALRGLAILWIAAYHIWQLSWMEPSITIGNFTLDLSFLVRDGHLGVELFIYLSGFSLFYPFARSIFAGTPAPTWPEFYRKRALRILPSYCLAILIALLFFNTSITNFKDGVWHVLTHLLFIHNLFLNTYDSILTVLWMMGLIIQFYYLFPLLCNAFRKKPLLTFVLISALSITYRLLIIKFWSYDTTRLISILPAFLDVFLFGMAAAYVVCYLKQYGERMAKFKLHGTLVAVLALVIFVRLIQDSYHYILDVKNGYGIWQSTNRFTLSMDFFLFTVSATFAYKAFIRIFANPVTFFLAAVSYNFYFWHQQIARFFFLNKLLPAAGTITKPEDQRLDTGWQLLFTLVAFALSLGVAALITYGFEKPVVKMLPRVWKRIRGGTPPGADPA